MTKPKTATASKYKVADTIRIAQLTDENDVLTQENKDLKVALDTANNIIEGGMKAESIGRIKAISDYKDAELEPLSIEELLTIEKSLLRSKGLATLPSRFQID